MDRQKVLFKTKQGIRLKGFVARFNPVYSVSPLKIMVEAIEGGYKGTYFICEEKDLISLL